MLGPSMFIVLNKLIEPGIEKGDPCMMVVFAAGLSSHP